MSAFCVPTPSIIPLRVPICGESKYIDNQTKIEILCVTDVAAVESFYTLDGTKPQPYVNIVQGSKTYKYTKPFSVPSGKVTIKAIAIHPILRTMCSNIVTRTYFVKDVAKQKSKKSLLKKKSVAVSKNELSLKTAESKCEATRSALNSETLENVDYCVDSGNNEISDGDIAVPERDMFFNCSENDSFIQSAFSESDDVSSEDENGSPGLLPLDPMPKTLTMPKILEEPEHSPAEEEVSLAEEESPSHVCLPLNVPLQECLTCHKINNLLARFCDSCGEKLHKICIDCQERNPSIAKFCQFCGGRFDATKATIDDDIITKTIPIKEQQSIGILVKPVMDGRSTNTQVTSVVSQSVQTYPQPAHKNKLSSPLKKINLPKKSTGRGYWRQQLDYICNHLKAHSNNNLNFQKMIGSPPLGKFLFAEVVQNDQKVSISITFEDLTNQSTA